MNNKNERRSKEHMNATFTKRLADNAAPVSGGSRSIGPAIETRLTEDGADLACVFVTNGGYSGVQQVLKLSTRYRQHCNRPNGAKRLSGNGHNDWV
jgi:adenosylmethionine-8-amino-7-oxononanoate aminotransferase